MKKMYVTKVRNFEVLAKAQLFHTKKKASEYMKQFGMNKFYYRAVADNKVVYVFPHLEIPLFYDLFGNLVFEYAVWQAAHAEALKIIKATPSLSDTFTELLTQEQNL